MNIAILGVRGIPSRYGGFETSAEQTAIRMVKLGHRVTVYCRSSKKQNKLAEYEGVRLVYMPHYSFEKPGDDYPFYNIRLSCGFH